MLIFLSMLLFQSIILRNFINFVVISIFLNIIDADVSNVCGRFGKICWETVERCPAVGKVAVKVVGACSEEEYNKHTMCLNSTFKLHYS